MLDINRLLIVVVGMAFLSAVPLAAAQQGALRHLESEIQARITSRVIRISGFRFDSSDFDLRLPIHGEPEEIVGPSTHASEARAVGSARIEPLDSVTSRDVTFNRVRYDIRLEDRAGNCLIVHQTFTWLIEKLDRGRRTSERCQPLYMADVIRRARRIARLPLSAGRLTDHWSAALAAKGTADVYMDSVVITTTALTLRASYPVPATASVVVDSIGAGLAMGESSWNVVRQSAAIPVDTTLRQGGEWRRKIKRFVIPIDSTFALAKSWPVFEVKLSVPKTADNPIGRAWTYAHERKGFFDTVSAR